MGNKNSGRKMNWEEELAISCINKGWGFLEKELSNPKTPKAVKREIALRICSRAVPQQIKMDKPLVENHTHYIFEAKYGVTRDEAERVAEEILKKRSGQGCGSNQQ